MTARSYESLPAFSDVVLEESWVRQVIASPGRVLFLVEAVIAKDSPLLQDPRPGEQFFWLPGVIQFEGVSSLEWTDQQGATTELDGTQDYDHIDSLTVDGDVYVVESGAGTLRLTATDVVVQLDESRQS